MAIRAYKAAKTIGKTLEAILAQETDFPFEVIVADDASPDDTLAVCQAYQRQAPDKLRILRAKQNGGLCVNDVLAHAHARGEWIAECDADDLWLDPRKLQKQLDLCRAHGAVFCGTAFFFHDPAAQRRWLIPFPRQALIPTRDVWQYYFQTSTFFYRADAYRRMIREIPLPFEGDPFKFHCLARYGKMVYLNDVCSAYTVGEGLYSAYPQALRDWGVVGGDLALALYGPPALRRRYAYLALKQIRRALDPKNGLTRAEYEARKDLLWATARGLARRLCWSPAALLLLRKIHARTHTLRQA